MDTEENINKDDYVVEVWWHRFLRVLMYVTTICALAIAGNAFLLTSNLNSYTYVYSFEPDYEPSTGIDLGLDTCTAPRFFNSISCGELDTSEKFISYAEISGNKKIREIIRSFRKQGKVDVVIARSIINGGDIKYRQIFSLDYTKLFKNILITIGIGVLWYVLTFFIYKVILFIVHGHTRVRTSDVSNV